MGALSSEHSFNGRIPNEKIDQRLTLIYKDLLSVPKITEVCFLYMPTSLGGAGITSLRNEYCIQSVVQAFNILACDDQTTSAIAKANLLQAAKDRYRLAELNIESALEFLNGLPYQTNCRTRRCWLLIVERPSRTSRS